ncbi:MAG: AmmeMemoRadiSam system radical SAM enzyme [Chloroflexales bacterium]|nr:AmmeMemoRadiSam system radical SAM enzyme [Chloroflexales bacterium]
MTTTLLTQLTYPGREPDTLICGLCAHRCGLRAGQVGRCGAILHRAGALHSRAAGRPAVLHADPVERKPLYHVLPGAKLLSLGTLGCNMSCDFCQNWRISQIHPNPAGDSIPPAAVVAAALDQGCAGIAFTYNEPTIYLDYAAAIMALAKQAGLLTAFKTNGYLTPEAIVLLTQPDWPLLDAVNVDLKGFDDGYYRRVCGARLQPVQDAIMQLHRRGVWVETTTLLIPSVNDSDGELRALTGWLASVSPDMPWHVWRFHPDYRMTDATWTHVRDVERALAIGRAAGLRYVYASNLPGDPNQHTRCSGCGAALIERAGNATTALHLEAGRCGKCGWSIPGRFAQCEVQK